ncbi:MAG: class I SAM-dependent methyltransferase [Flavisolibacter sp.]|jgi:2-polyprenyl-3-methyl-5-hydroxy-6-metoxy-1,4-benzoquinol methylase
MNTVHYTSCPVCDSRDINPLLTVKDHSVSKQDFVIWQCTNCSLRFTQDVPDSDSIGEYYRSPEYISHTNIATGPVNRLYQKVRKHTLSQKASLITRFTVTAGAILDIGAGTGAFLHTMKEKNWKVTGIEPDAGAREEAKKSFEVELQDIHHLEKLSAGSFDAITMWHVLEHVHDLHATVEKLKSLLKPDGKMFIAVPNYTSGDSSIYKLFWAAYDVPRHLYHFTPKTMKVLLERHNLSIIEKKPMWFDAFYISLLSSKYRKGRTSWIGATISGLRSNITAMVNRDRCSSVIYIAGKN